MSVVDSHHGHDQGTETSLSHEGSHREAEDGGPIDVESAAAPGSRRNSKAVPDVATSSAVTGVASAMGSVKMRAIRNNQRRFIAGGILVVIVVVTVVVLAAVLAPRKGSSSADNSPNLAPSPAPTPAPTSAELPNVLGAIRSINDTLVNRTDTSSPQYQAAMWLAEDHATGSLAYELDANDAQFVQRYALAVFFFAMTGDPYMFCETNASPACERDTWLTKSDVCTWWGLQCSDGKVVDRMSFSVWSYPFDESDPVIGTLPTELALLTNLRTVHIEGVNIGGTLEGKFASPKLQTLTLNRTGIYGALPSDLFLNNPNLRSLTLAYNRIDGTLPSSLWSSTALQNVTLQSNQFSGPLEETLNIDNASLSTSAIRRLEVSYNELTGTIPDALGGLSGLETLSFRHNQLDGTIGLPLASLTQLTSLDLQENRFTIVDDSIFSLSALETLCLNDNPMTGTLSSSIGALTSLQELRIGTSSLSGPLPTELYSLPLSILDVSRAKFTGRLPGSLISALNATATQLLLQHNDFRGTVPTELAQLQHLKYLLLFENRFTGTVPMELCDLRTSQQNLVDLRVSCDVNCSCCNTCVSVDGSIVYNVDDWQRD